MSRLLATILASSLLASTSQARPLEFHSGLPEEQKRTLEHDIVVLDRMAPKDDEATAEAAKKMGIADKMTPFALRSWLEERVHYILPQDWDYKNGMRQKLGQTYPNAGAFPDFEKPTKQASDGKGEATKGTVMVVMANLGTALYMGGKQMHALLTVQVDADQREDVLSPRLGLIKVGQGLFSERLRVDEENAASAANSILRLATLFHEARHSDGNGKSLGFVHGNCPEGHSYAGYSACDKTQNGAYMIGAHVTKVMLSQCDDCSVAAKEAIRAKVLDSFSRVMPKTIIPKEDSDTLILQTRILMCELSKQMGKEEDPKCATYRAQLADGTHSTTVDTVEVDPTPEAIIR